MAGASSEGRRYRLPRGEELDRIASATASMVWNNAARVAVLRGSCNAPELAGLEVRHRASRASGAPARPAGGNILLCSRKASYALQMSRQHSPSAIVVSGATRADLPPGERSALLR